MLILMRGLLANLRWNLDERVTGRFHLELNIGGFEQRFHQHKSLACRLADREQAMIVQDQRAILAERLVDSRTLAEIFGDAFVVVIADTIEESHGRLREHAQSRL